MIFFAFVTICSTVGAFSVLCAFQAKELTNQLQQEIRDAKENRENERQGLVKVRSASADVRPDKSWSKRLSSFFSGQSSASMGPPRQVSLELHANRADPTDPTRRARQASNV